MSEASQEVIRRAKHFYECMSAYKGGQKIENLDELVAKKSKKIQGYYDLGCRRGLKRLEAYLYTIAKSRLFVNCDRKTLAEDFLQSFFIECLSQLRRIYSYSSTYTPKSRLENAEFFAFCEWHATRKIPGSDRHLVVLRLISYGSMSAKQMNRQIACDFSVVDSAIDSDALDRRAILFQLKQKIATDHIDKDDSAIAVLDDLIRYLRDRKQFACIKYLKSRLKDKGVSALDQELGLTPRQRDRLQQTVAYQASTYLFSPNTWQRAHEWLDAGLSQSLGLSPKALESARQQMTSQQQTILDMRSQGEDDKSIMAVARVTEKRLALNWTQILTIARQERNKGGVRIVD